MYQSFDERNRDLIVSVGGRLTHRDEAAVSPFDSVVQSGDAVITASVRRTAPDSLDPKIHHNNLLTSILEGSRRTWLAPTTR